MNRFAALTLASLCACASSTVATGGPSTGTLREVGPGSGMTITTEASTAVKSVPFSLDQVWRALPAIYDSLGIPIASLDPKTHTLGNQAYKTRQRLGKAPLSRFIECGTTQIGPNADSYDIVLTALTQVQPGDAGTTTVTTTFEAAAKPIAFAQDYSHCSSKGLFESRLIDAIVAKLQR